MKNTLIVLVVLGACFKFGVLKNPFESKQEVIAGYDHQVVLYATAWCGYCKKTRALFKEHGIPYKEYDIEKSLQGKQEYDRLNGRGIPLVVVNGVVIRGYNPELILKSLSKS